MPHGRRLEPWQVLASEYLHREPWLTVRKDHVRLPTGAEIEHYFVLEYPTFVNVVAITPEDRFVLVRQYRHGSRTINFELPAGVVEPGDADELAAAKRELLEETGYGGGEWGTGGSPLMILSANASTTSNLTYSFLARNVTLQRPPAPEATEHLEVHLLTRTEVKDLVLGGAGEIIQSLNIAPLLKVLFASDP